MNAIVSWVYKIVSSTLLLFLVISLASAYIPTDIIWFAPILSFAFPVLALLYWLVILSRYFKRKKNTYRLFVLLALSFAYLNNQVRLTSYISDDTDFKVMGFNARLFDIYNWINREEWADWAPRSDDGLVLKEIYQTIRSSEADVICFQEFYFQPKSIFATLDSLKKMGYKHAHYTFLYKDFSRGLKHHYGIGTFSKYPIINKSTFTEEQGFSNGALLTDVKIKKDTIRFMNVHFNSYRFSKENHKTIQLLKKGKLKQLQTDSLGDVLDHMKVGLKVRNQEIEQVESMISNSPFPVVISCDLNESPNTAGYKALTRQLNDAFLESGFGVGKTLVTPYPIRIDFLLHSPELKSANFKVIDKVISDHYPIVCDFNIE